ncbi:MAG: sulfite exporter TauE/SafE family protein [Actinomycetota bacterium]
MTHLETVLTVLVGLLAGLLSGLFGVGGGIVMTPGLSALAGVAPIVAVATPLPVILPTAMVGAFTYHRAGEVDVRAAAWISLTGAGASAVGALLTRVVNARLLLIVTALLLVWQSIQILRGRSRSAPTDERPTRWWALALVGVGAGLVSGLLGIGGGTLIVPALAGMLGMPLKRALGTSLVAVVVLVIPGTIVHAALGHLDWAAALFLVMGSLPGARIGARIALGTEERTLRLLVGSFLAIVAVAYGVQQIVELTSSR